MCGDLLVITYQFYAAELNLFLITWVCTLQSEHKNVKILKYVNGWNFFGILNFKTYSSFYIDVVEKFWNNITQSICSLMLIRCFWASVDHIIFMIICLLPVNQLTNSFKYWELILVVALNGMKTVIVSITSCAPDCFFQI